MAGRRMGSSTLLEFLVALVVGSLAVVGALLCIGFLLVEPIRSPPSEAPTVSLADMLNSDGCEPVTREKRLPVGCTLKDGGQSIPVSSCSHDACQCNEDLLQGTVCCCRGTQKEDLSTSIQCRVPDMVPQITNVTQCGCNACDDIEVAITIAVKAVESNNPIIAARIFRMDSPSEFTLLGITDNSGRFLRRLPVGAGPLVFMIQAQGYLSQSTSIIDLDPAHPIVRREIILMPSMDLEIGLGAAPLILRLGTMISVSAGPRSWRDVSGDVYEDIVFFRGNLIEVDNEANRDTIPLASFQYIDPTTGEVQRFGILAGMVLQFVDRSGQPLSNPEGLSIIASIPTDGQNLNDVNLVTYDPFLGVWNKTSRMTEVDPFRKKRQDTVNRSPVLLEGRLIRLDFFVALAPGRGVNCWFQTRAFELDGVAPTDRTVVTMRQTAFLLNIFTGPPILIQFTGETGLEQTNSDGLVSNALCLPVACDDIVESVLVASDSFTDESLFPIEFSDTVFDMDEIPPTILSTAFLFTQAPLSQVDSPRPFYGTLDECVAAGMLNSTTAEPSEHFSFRVATGMDLDSPDGGTDVCFIKVLINACFDSNIVSLNSIDINSGIGVTDFFPVDEVIPVTTTSMTTDMPTTDAMTTDALTTMLATDGMTTEDMMDTGSGTTPVDTTVMTTEDPTTMMPTTDPPTTPDTTTPGTTQTPLCSAETSTVRGACLPYTCGDNIRIMVFPNPLSSIPQNSFCEVTATSVLLQGSPFLTSTNMTEQLNILSVANPGQGNLELQLLRFSDFNDPNLGLYTDTSGSDMAANFAEQRCNAGMGENSMLPEIDLTQGYAAIFSCFEEP